MADGLITQGLFSVGGAGSTEQYYPVNLDWDFDPGKNIEFRFAWKKRPADAPETDWPTDHMGFTADSPDGKHTEFSFTRKTRTLPADDPEKPISETHSGLGQATMEFVSRRPGHRDFRFTWNKVPPG